MKRWEPVWAIVAAVDDERREVIYLLGDVYETRSRLIARYRTENYYAQEGESWAKVKRRDGLRCVRMAVRWSVP